MRLVSLVAVTDTFSFATSLCCQLRHDFVTSYTRRSGGPEIRLLWATGPNKNEKAGPTLGFENVDSEWSDTHSGKPMSLDLDMMITSDQVTIFTYELMQELDNR